MLTPRTPEEGKELLFVTIQVTGIEIMPGSEVMNPAMSSLEVGAEGAIRRAAEKELTKQGYPLNKLRKQIAVRLVDTDQNPMDNLVF